MGTEGQGGDGPFPTGAHFAEPGTNGSTICLDGLLGLRIIDFLPTRIVGRTVACTFQSERATATDPGLQPWSTAPGGCLFIENGLPREVGTVSFSDCAGAHTQVATDVVPVSVTLMLVGSGLAIAGELLGRYR